MDLRGPNDHASAYWAALLLSRYCRSTEIDLPLVTGYMRRQDIGTCGPALGQIGVMTFRGKVIRRGEHHFVPASLHLYALGCRDWGLHGMEKRILAKGEFHPAVKKKIAELQRRIVQLRKDKSPASHERVRRYEHAVDGLQQILTAPRRR